MASFQISANANPYCGDCVEVLKDIGGKSGVILADGMGTGLSAHLTADLCSQTMSKLLASGFSVAAAIKVANAALILKDGDECFSSLDLLVFDPFSGQTDFFKAGATCSFVKRKNKINRVELSSTPIGILESTDFAATSLLLSEGDVVLLLSDGVTQGDTSWINSLLFDKRLDSAFALAKAICETAVSKQPPAHSDDISAAVMMVGEN